jgi:hypothetical protein
MPFSAYAPQIAVLLIFGALLSAWRLARPRRGFGIIRQIDAAHLLMNASMALMLMPWYGARLAIFVTALYALLAVATLILLARALRPGRDRAGRISTYAYHLMVTLAMLYIITAMQPSQAAMPGMDMPISPPSRLAELIGLGFLLDAVVTSLTVTLFPKFAAQAATRSGDLEDETSIFALREGAVPHVIMDIGMVFMAVAMAG